MEALILIAIFIYVIVLVAKSRPAQPLIPGQANKYTAEQLRDREYKIIRRLAKLSTESSNIICNLQSTDADMRRCERLQDQIAALEKERELIKSELSSINNANKQAAQELHGLVRKHVELVMLLMKEKGFTEEQANTAILNKIESRQRQYQLKGLSEEQALEKAGRDVYRLAEQNSGFLESDQRL